jgi:uncharacterized protein (DUF2062 family)
MKNFFKQFFRIKDTPHKIAVGAATGIFLGVLPGPGVTASIVVASVFRINRLAAIAGALATNHWTTFFMFPLAAAVGCFIFGGERANIIAQFNQVYSLGFKFLFNKEILFDIVLPLTVGFVAVSGIIIALLCYMLTFSLIKIHRKTIIVS